MAGYQHLAKGKEREWNHPGVLKLNSSPTRTKFRFSFCLLQLTTDSSPLISSSCHGTVILSVKNIGIGHFTVVCLVTWPWIGSEAGGDLVLIQTSLLFICKCKLVSIRTA